MSMATALETEIPEGKSLIYKLDATGDTKIVFDRNDPVSVESARAAFTHAKRQGYVAYSVTGKEGLKGEVMGSFDPAAERIILAPPMQGGGR